jgi:hypothetical protein
MATQEDIDGFIGAFIEEEQNISPSPFLAVRVMGLIDRRTKEQAKFSPVWQGVAMGLSFIAAIALGIKSGNLYKPGSVNDDHGSVMFMSDEKMEHFRFYQQTLNE